MSTYYLFQDQKQCIGCQACVVVCKSIKALKQGPKPCSIITLGPKEVNGQPRESHVFMPCYHCEIPWCVSACPTGAMQRRAGDGVVFVQPSLCVGCKSCMIACPWGAPQWDPDQGIVAKCDLCKDRVDQGLKPACVTVCVTQCIHFGKPEEIPEFRRQRFAKASARE